MSKTEELKKRHEAKRESSRQFLETVSRASGSPSRPQTWNSQLLRLWSRCTTGQLLCVCYIRVTRRRVSAAAAAAIAGRTAQAAARGTSGNVSEEVFEKVFERAFETRLEMVYVGDS